MNSLKTVKIILSPVQLHFAFSNRFLIPPIDIKVSKGAKIRNRYNQVPHMTQDANGKVINLQLDTTNESQDVSPFPAGNLKAHINRRVKRHSKHKTEQKHKRSTKEVPPWNGQLNILLEGYNQFNGANLTLTSDVDQNT